VYAPRTIVLTMNVRQAYIFIMKLKEWRERENLSLAEMGRRIDRAHSTVLRIESGSQMPDWRTVYAIHQATNGEVTLHDFYRADGFPTPKTTKSGKTRRVNAHQ